MQILERRFGGYRVQCECSKNNAFFQPSSLSVECPRCGKTGNYADLVADWMASHRDAALHQTKHPLKAAE